MLKNIRIVLVATTHPGNIGSSARALKTMGLDQLYLVQPKLFPDPKAYALAAGADDILDEAVVVDTIQEALVGCQLAIATSARPRELEMPTLDPRQCGQRIISEAKQAPVAIVFGREHAGLTNDELLQCQYHVLIPANEHYSSLNLAAAVQIICYDIRMAMLTEVSQPEDNLPIEQKDRYAALDELEKFYQHLEAVLRSIHFLRPRSPKRIMPRLRRLFGRIRLENREVRLLRGILSMIEKKYETEDTNLS